MAELVDNTSDEKGLIMVLVSPAVSEPFILTGSIRGGTTRPDDGVFEGRRMCMLEISHLAPSPLHAQSPAETQSLLAIEEGVVPLVFELVLEQTQILLPFVTGEVDEKLYPADLIEASAAEVLNGSLVPGDRSY